MATRSKLTEPWGNVVAVGGVNTAKDDERYPMISGDGCVLYLTRGTQGAYDLYVATRHERHGEVIRSTV